VEKELIKKIARKRLAQKEESEKPFEDIKTPFDYVINKFAHVNKISVSGGEIKEIIEKFDSPDSTPEDKAKARAYIERGILCIYLLQTADEKEMMGTTHHNNIGFNSVHAGFGSSLAGQIQRGRAQGRLVGTILSPKQLPLAKKIIVKYVGQLAKIANKEIILPEEKIKAA